MRASPNRLGGASERPRRRQPPPLPVRYTGIARISPALTKPGASVLLTRRRDGVLRRDIGNTVRCERIFRKRPQGARSEARAGPLRRRGGNIRSTASRTHRAMEDTAPLAKTKKLNTKALIPKNQGFICARYWDRTSDLFRVREARYRCANRAHKTIVLLRGEDGIRNRVHGFAGRCLTTRPPHRIRSPGGTRSNSWSPYERLTRLELATSTLARWCSTN